MTQPDHSRPAPAPPRTGDPAPDFALPDASGNSVRLSDFRGRAVVLFFYPGDFTPGCTVEACAFRDAYEDFARAGAAVIGVSGDAPTRHASFARAFGLPFTLLSDVDGEARRLYGVRSTLGVLPGRATFLIDGEGIVRHTFSSQFRPKKHVTEALRILQGLLNERTAPAGPESR